MCTYVYTSSSQMRIRIVTSKRPSIIWPSFQFLPQHHRRNFSRRAPYRNNVSQIYNATFSPRVSLKLLLDIPATSIICELPRASGKPRVRIIDSGESLKTSRLHANINLIVVVERLFHISLSRFKRFRFHEKVRKRERERMKEICPCFMIFFCRTSRNSIFN